MRSTGEAGEPASKNDRKNRTKRRGEMPDEDRAGARFPASTAPDRGRGPSREAPAKTEEGRDDLNVQTFTSP